MNPKTSTVSRSMTSAYRYCAELVGGPTEAGYGAGLVMAVGEDARERNGGDQPFRTLEEVGAIGFVEGHAQHFEQRRGLVGLASPGRRR